MCYKEYARNVYHMRPHFEMTRRVILFLLMIYTFRASYGKERDNMVFRTLKGCRRSGPEQRYIFSLLEIWNTLSEAKREEIRDLIGRLAATPVEGRALYDVLVRQRSPQSVNFRTGVSVQRLYELRRRFYDEFRR